MLKCTSCGYEADEGDVYCARCGKKLAGGKEEAGQEIKSKVILNSPFLRFADFLDDDALYRAGVCKLEGIGVAKKPEEAEEIFKTLAFRGHYDGMYKLAEMYLNSTPPNVEGAKAWLKTAAGGGHKKSAIKLKELNPAPESEEQITIPEGGLEGLVQAALPSVLLISAGGKGLGKTGLSAGSGFILDGGYVLTNAHVVGESPDWVTAKFEPSLDDKTYALAPLAICPDLDIAVLKFTGLAERKVTARKNLTLRLDRANFGESVYTIGNPLGIGFSVSKGVVSCPNRKTNYPKGVEEVIQTDITANHGNSGGALFDQNNNVLGMITYTPIDSSGGIAMCVPSKYIVHVLNNIKI
jgi:S1-C subfamily serine protease